MNHGILNSIVRAWTGITPPEQEAPKGHAISAVLTEVLSQETRRELRPGSGPEALHAHPPEGSVIRAWVAPSAGHPLEAGSREEDPGLEASEVPLEAEALEDRPEVVSAAADGVVASEIS